MGLGKKSAGKSASMPEIEVSLRSPTCTGLLDTALKAPESKAAQDIECQKKIKEERKRVRESG